MLNWSVGSKASTAGKWSLLQEVKILTNFFEKTSCCCFCSNLLFNRCLFESHPIPDTCSAAAAAVASCSKTFEIVRIVRVQIRHLLDPGGFRRSLTVGEKRIRRPYLPGAFVLLFRKKSLQQTTNAHKGRNYQRIRRLSFLLFGGKELLTAAPKYAEVKN